MLPYRDSRFTVIALGVFFAIALGYAVFESRGMALGPTIDIVGNTSEVHEPNVVIQGRASRISSLSMNGEPIQVTEDGEFSEPYLLATGYNRIVLDAKDQYGRGAQRIIEVMYIPTSQSSLGGTSYPQTAPPSTAATPPNSSSTTPIAQ